MAAAPASQEERTSEELALCSWCVGSGIQGYDEDFDLLVHCDCVVGAQRKSGAPEADPADHISVGGLDSLSQAAIGRVAGSA